MSNIALSATYICPSYHKKKKSKMQHMHYLKGASLLLRWRILWLAAVLELLLDADDDSSAKPFWKKWQPIRETNRRPTKFPFIFNNALQTVNAECIILLKYCVLLSKNSFSIFSWKVANDIFYAWEQLSFLSLKSQHSWKFVWPLFLGFRAFNWRILVKSIA